jgi:putative heme-binding domain-containing protein
MFATARDTAGDRSVDEAKRVAALKLLALDARPASVATLRNLAVDVGASEALRKVAIEALDAHAGIAALLVQHWPGSTGSLKAAALTVLTERPDRALVLLEAARDGVIPKADIDPNTATLLRQHRDAKVKALAAELFPIPEAVSREAIIEKYEPALNLEGDAARGAEVYVRAACFTCHKAPDGQGFRVGPDLVTFKTAGGKSLLAKIFDPGAEIAPQYQAYVFSLKSGEVVMGIISREDQSDVTVRMAGGVERTFPRKDVAGMKGLGQSLMPEGLEAALSEQDVADLLSFILK